MRAGRPQAGLAALLAVLVLAGCGGLSRHTSVQEGLDVGSGSAPQVRVLFPGPFPGADREQIVRGFVRAGSASDGAYDRAREFLTDPMAKQWTPDGPVVVVSSESSETVTITGPGSARLGAVAEGVISADGHYTTLPPKTRRTATIGFARIDGEWRIADLPKTFGRWILAEDVPRLLRPYAVHYVADDRQALVSDVRWFPLDHLTTRLARAQLSAVPDYLGEAARTEVPEGARLLADGVPVLDGVATVDLSARVPTDQAVREGLWAQFVATLTQVPGVVNVALRVDGASLDLRGVGTPVATIDDLGFEPETPSSAAGPLLRVGTELRVLEADVEQRTSAPRPTAAYPQIPVGVTDLALSLSGTDIAGVEPGRASLALWRGDKRTQVGGFGGTLGRPSFDRLGDLWVGVVGSKRSLAARLWVLAAASGASEEPAPVEADWLTGRRVTGAVVAPDGQRIAIVSTNAAGGGARIDVSGIVRDGDGLPVRLAEAKPLGSPVTGFAGLAWLDNESITSLGRDTSNALRPYVIGLAGDVRALSPTPDAVAIASTGGERAIRVVTSAGMVLARAGQQWVEEAEGTGVLVPGR